LVALDDLHNAQSANTNGIKNEIEKFPIMTGAGAQTGKNAITIANMTSRLGDNASRASAVRGCLLRTMVRDW
jgi:hypothetical protein